MLTKWDHRFMSMAEMIAGWSKDPSTKVGCVIVNPHNLLVSGGYNGFPNGVEDHPDYLHDRELKYPRVVHAELNALLNIRWTITQPELRLYCTMFPCSSCAGAIINSHKIASVYTRHPSADMLSRWGSNFETSKLMFEESGIPYIFM